MEGFRLQGELPGVRIAICGEENSRILRWTPLAPPGVRWQARLPKLGLLLLPFPPPPAAVLPIRLNFGLE